jgi:hypothetical protein
MEEDNPSKPPRTRKPRTKLGTRAVGAKGTTPRSRRAPAPDEDAATASASRSGSNGNPEPPPQFDHLVADDGFVRDFDRMTSSNPKSAVLTALFVGVAMGFVAALILSRD